MSAFIVSPPDTTVWRVTPEALAQRIVSRWPHAEVGKREHAAPHEALYFRLTDGGSQVEGWLATSGQSVHLDAASVEDVSPFVLWLRTQVPRDQPLLLYDQGFNSQVALSGEETLSERELVERFTQEPLCYLTSGDEVFWSEPRACRPLGRTTVTDPARDVLILRIDPPAIGQGFGLGGEDIDVLAVSPADVGGSVAPLSLPLAVHLLLLRVPWSGNADDLRRDDLWLVGRGRLVATSAEAEARDRSMQRMNGPRR